MSHWTSTSARMRYGKFNGLSTQEEAKKCHNAKCYRLAVQSLRIHGRRLSNHTIVLRSLQSSSRTSLGSHMMIEMLERHQISTNQLTLTWYLLWPPIVVSFHWVFSQGRNIYNVRHTYM